MAGRSNLQSLQRSLIDIHDSFRSIANGMDQFLILAVNSYSLKDQIIQGEYLTLLTNSHLTLAISSAQICLNLSSSRIMGLLKSHQ